MSRNVKFHNLSPEKRKSILKGMIDAGTNHDGQSHYEFSQTSEKFKSACEKSNIKPTPRQASKFRKKKGLAWTATLVLMLMFVSTAQAGSFNLQTSFQNVYDSNAEDYLHSTTNVRKYAEWQNPPITYWGTIVNEIDSEIIYKFSPGGKITDGTIYVNVAQFDFGDSWGEASIWGSKNNLYWRLLSKRTSFGTPESPETLPGYLLGGNELYIRGLLRTYNSPNSSYSMAQLGRSNGSADIFSINLNAIPEPTTCILFLAGLINSTLWRTKHA